MLFAVCFMQVWYGSRRSTVKTSTASASSPTPPMLDHEEVVRDLKKALQRAHVRNKNVKKQLVRSHQSQQRATDIIASLRKDSDATKKRLASILLRKRAETRLKNVYKQKYISSRSSIAKLQANASKMRQKLIAAEKEVEQLRATAQQNTSNKIVTLSGSPPRTEVYRLCPAMLHRIAGSQCGHQPCIASDSDCHTPHDEAAYGEAAKSIKNVCLSWGGKTAGTDTNRRVSSER